MRVVAAYAAGHFFNDACASVWFSYLLIFLTAARGLSGVEAGRTAAAIAVGVLMTSRSKAVRVRVAAAAVIIRLSLQLSHSDSELELS